MRRPAETITGAAAIAVCVTAAINGDTTTAIAVGITGALPAVVTTLVSGGGIVGWAKKLWKGAR